MRGRAAQTLYGCFLQAGGAARQDGSADAWLEAHFRPVNLFSTPQPIWDARRARESASQLKYREIAERDRVVMLGRNVSRAMRFPDLPFFQSEVVREVAFVLIPHPSGANRMLNDEENRLLVGRALRTILDQ